jgi:hypothetical protein
MQTRNRQTFLLKKLKIKKFHSSTMDIFQDCLLLTTYNSQDKACVCVFLCEVMFIFTSSEYSYLYPSRLIFLGVQNLF